MISDQLLNFVVLAMAFIAIFLVARLEFKYVDEPWRSFLSFVAAMILLAVLATVGSYVVNG